MKKNVSISTIFLSTILILAIFLAGCSQSTSGKESKGQKVSIALDSGVFSLPFRVAGDQGFLKKHGVDAEFSTYSFGIDTLNTVISNQADIGIAMDYAALTRLGKGDLKIITRFTIPSPSRLKLIVKDEINKPEDLKGKRLGVQRGTVNEYVWARYLDKFNIDKSDVTLEPLTSTAEIYAAFEKGEIDGAWFDGSFLAKATEVKGSKVLNDLNDINFAMRGYVVASGDFAQKNPETVKNIIKALNEANPYIKKHPDQAANLAFKELKLPADKVQEELKKDWDFNLAFTQEDVQHLQEILDWTQKNGLIKEQFDIEDKTEVEPLKEVYPDKAK
ncbi:ABC transporter substrate-binding protein [Bacillus sp. 03113]|uniref:ABC transporter substrate-binding protein n=1 Tax=Bacillus sp. 03113 TaxID=2578211 RepID=UPI0011441982|nr:ABC transporter substrate-binding protein [Bacillus sp. 03113]